MVLALCLPYYLWCVYNVHLFVWYVAYIMPVCLCVYECVYVRCVYVCLCTVCACMCLHAVFVCTALCMPVCVQVCVSVWLMISLVSIKSAN